MFLNAAGKSGTGFFNIRDYGATGNGTTDDFTAIQNAILAAGGDGVVYCPPGTYYLAKAGGRGLRLPQDAAGLTIEGAGIGATVFKCSPEVPRAFDLLPSTSTPLFSNLTLRRFTIDANNLGGLSQGPLTTLASPYTLAAGWNTLTVTSNAGWVSVGAAYFPSTNTGNSAGMSMAMQIPNGSSTTIQVRNDGATRTISAGDTIQGCLNGHVIVGDSLDGGTVANWNNSISNLTVEDVQAINIPTQIGTALGVTLPTARQGIQIQPTLNAPASTPSIQKVRIRRVDIQGGAIGVSINYPGALAAAFVDDVVFEDCRHTTGVLPTNNYTSLNYMIGVGAWGGRAVVRRCWGEYSGDVGIETDSLMDALVEDCTIDDAWGGGFYHTNYNSPADSISGPVKTTLSGSMTNVASSCTVTAVPDGIPAAGWCRIDLETLWYVLNAGSTTVNVYRNLNGSSAAAHSSGADVVFHEGHRQRMVYRGCRSRQRRLTATTSWCPKGWYQFAGAYGLPTARTYLRDCHADCSYTEMEGGGADIALFDGCSPLVDMDGVTLIRNGINHTTLDSTTGRVMRFKRAGNLYATNTTQVFPDRVRLRNVEIRATGTLATGSNSPKNQAIALEQGYWELDEWDVRVHQQLLNANPAATTGLILGTNPSSTLVGTIDRYRYANLSGDAAPTALSIPSTAFTTIRNLRIRELETEQLNYSTGTGQTNYRPFVVDTTNAAAVVIEKVRHPVAITATTAAFPVQMLRRTATATSYTATHLDAYIGVTSTASARTITLPLATGGVSSGIPVAAGSPITVKDESGAAGTNNITVAAAGSETIDGAASKTISTNYGSLRIMSTGSGWSVI